MSEKFNADSKQPKRKPLKLIDGYYLSSDKFTWILIELSEPEKKDRQTGKQVAKSLSERIRTGECTYHKTLENLIVWLINKAPDGYKYESLKELLDIQRKMVQDVRNNLKEVNL